ncbi:MULTISPECIES: hypothetical protein [unclassified Methylobacterium]|jgi:hypothetical protein|uniref:hypothetical protein n=1 Tax=unclassified Methylobacterium TaxID=2615210 RepID=UPI0005B98DB4|nr:MULTISPECIES: hypothetical protein [unclassified Methylobacterium]SFU97229.1 hypothetical protein SAMN02799643_03568 [Methylobacterium sp. UNCCL125]
MAISRRGMLRGALQISANEATMREYCLPAPGSVERSSSSFAGERARPSPLEHEQYARRQPNSGYQIKYPAADL